MPSHQATRGWSPPVLWNTIYLPDVLVRGGLRPLRGPTLYDDED